MLSSKKQEFSSTFFYISIVFANFSSSFPLVEKNRREAHIREIYTGPLPVLTEYSQESETEGSQRAGNLNSPHVSPFRYANDIVALFSSHSFHPPWFFSPIRPFLERPRLFPVQRSCFPRLNVNNLLLKARGERVGSRPNINGQKCGHLFSFRLPSLRLSSPSFSSITTHILDPRSSIVSRIVYRIVSSGEYALRLF